MVINHILSTTMYIYISHFINSPIKQLLLAGFGGVVVKSHSLEQLEGDSVEQWSPKIDYRQLKKGIRTNTSRSKSNKSHPRQPCSRKHNRTGFSVYKETYKESTKSISISKNLLIEFITSQEHTHNGDKCK